MTRPILVDIFGFLLPLAIGLFAFLAGRSLHRWPKLLRITSVVAAISIIAVAAISLFRFTPIGVAQVLSHFGGSITLLCWTALLIFGVVWSVRRRSLSSGFLATLVAVAGCLILIENSGRLWWRFCAPQLWRHTTDSNGRIQQSSGLTCSPAAAVMLLHYYGITASEGEMAYLAGTSLFGTDAFAMADGLNRKLLAHSLHAQVRRIDYETCVRDGGPFIAHVHEPYLGHALLVKSASAEQVIVFDPLDGQRKTLSRADFETEWDGTAIIVSQRSTAYVSHFKTPNGCRK